MAYAHEKIVYGLLLRCAATALQKLARDPQHLGGQPGVLAVLHTWTRDLRYHPHVHLLVTGGARGQQLHRVTLTAEEFIHRFLQHTLPRSFAKGRYYGLFSPAARPLREQARTLLPATAVTAAAHTAQSPSSLPIAPAPAIPAPPVTVLCPFCQLGQLRLLAVLPRRRPYQAAPQPARERKVPP